MTRPFAFLASALLASLLAGCGPEVDRSELGTVVFEVPEVPGAEEPYPLPELHKAEGSSTGDPQPPAASAEPEKE